jgi:VIT1/CCC1 family predicted Fe2+/Mn2+ transporter
VAKRKGPTPARQRARRVDPTAPFLTPDASPLRAAVERRSATVIVFLSHLPRALPGLVVVLLVAAGLLAPPVVSGVALLVVGALLAWLVFLSWGRVPAVGRAVRCVVIALVLGYALTRFAA